MSDAFFVSTPANHVFTPVPWSDTDWIVRDKLKFCSVILQDFIEVQPNFVTDFASIPDLFRFKYLPTGRWRLAAVLHDWLFWNQLCTFEQANDVLKEAMLVCGCGAMDANLFHFAVSMGSRSVWDKYAAMTPEQRKLLGFATIKDDGSIFIPEEPGVFLTPEVEILK
jgi:hypothetical protein